MWSSIGVVVESQTVRLFVQLRNEREFEPQSEGFFLIFIVFVFVNIKN